MTTLRNGRAIEPNRTEEVKRFMRLTRHLKVNGKDLQAMPPANAGLRGEHANSATLRVKKLFEEVKGK